MHNRGHGLAMAAAATVLPVLAPPPAWLAVDEVSYHHHEGRGGKPDTLRVEYRCGLTWHREWVCFDHLAVSYARRRADLWWKRRNRLGAPEWVPANVAQAVKVIERAPEGLAKPSGIRVKVAGRYTEVTDYRFDKLDEENAR